MPRNGALLFASILCVAAAPPAPSAVDTTAARLWEDSEAYHGKLVRVEGVVRYANEHGPFNEYPRHYNLTLEPNIDLSIRGEGKAPAAEGDRVRITGTFTYKESSFIRYRLAVTKVEKLPAKK